MDNEDKLEAIFDLEAGLTGWEIDFCEDVARLVDAGKRLTEKQQAVLDRIYAKRVEGL